MPTQRLEERKLEELMGEGEREKERRRGREKEKKSVDAGEKKRKGFGSSFYMFFPPPGPALCKLGLARSAVCST